MSAEPIMSDVATDGRITGTLTLGGLPYTVAMTDDYQPGAVPVAGGVPPTVAAAFELARLALRLANDPERLAASMDAAAVLLPDAAQLHIVARMDDDNDPLTAEQIHAGMVLAVDALLALCPPALLPGQARVRIGGEWFMVFADNAVLDLAADVGPEIAEQLGGLLADKVGGAVVPSVGVLGLELLAERDALHLSARIDDPADSLTEDEVTFALMQGLSALTGRRIDEVRAGHSMAETATEIDEWLAAQLADVGGDRPSVEVHIMGRPYTAVYPDDLGRLVEVVAAILPRLANAEKARGMARKRADMDLAGLVGRGIPVVFSAAVEEELKARCADKADPCTLAEVAKGLIKALTKLDKLDPPPPVDPPPGHGGVPFNCWTELTPEGRYVFMVEWLDQQAAKGNGEMHAMVDALAEAATRADYLAAVMNQFAFLGMDDLTVIGARADLEKDLPPLRHDALLPLLVQPNALRRGPGQRAAGVWVPVLNLLDPAGERVAALSVTAAEQIATDMLRVFHSGLHDAAYASFVRSTLTDGEPADAENRTRNVVADLGNFYYRIMDPEGAAADHAEVGHNVMYAPRVEESATARARSDPREGWL
jgi:hypothetical protein